MITMQDIRQRASSQSFTRGQQYYRDEAIFDAVQREKVLDGYCQGSDYEPYHVQVTLKADGGISTASCTCPYDFGGDCKHIVALLLTYLNQPEQFEQRQPIAQTLKQRSQDDLITLIEQMIAQYPDLERLLDRPMPSDSSNEDTRPPIQTDSIRRELQRLMQSFTDDYYYDDDYPYSRGSNPAANLESILQNGQRFAAVQDWRNALEIYNVMLEEITAESFYSEIDDLYDVLHSLMDEVKTCLEQESIQKNDALRRRTLLNLLAGYIQDQYDAMPGALDLINHYVQKSDLPDLQQIIRQAVQRARQSPYGDLRVDSLMELQLQFDAMAGDHDPEKVIEMLREAGAFKLLFEKLMEMQRHQAAFDLLPNDLPGYYRLTALKQLAEVGMQQQVIEMAEHFASDEDYSRNITNWLIEQYHALGNQEALYNLLRKRFLKHPVPVYYDPLKETAQALNRWDETREAIIQHTRQHHPSDLVRLYLHEQEWDAAWQLTEALMQEHEASRTNHWSMNFRYHSQLDLEVARASGRNRPYKAIPIYLKYARAAINRRSRNDYAVAAGLLADVKQLYQQLDDLDTWDKLISDLRQEFKRLPALQDELNKAGL